MGQGQVGCRTLLLVSEMVAQVLQQLLPHSLFRLLQHSSSCASWQTVEQKQRQHSNSISMYIGAIKYGRQMSIRGPE